MLRISSKMRKTKRNNKNYELSRTSFIFSDFFSELSCVEDFQLSTHWWPSTLSTDMGWVTNLNPSSKNAGVAWSALPFTVDQQVVLRMPYKSKRVEWRWIKELYIYYVLTGAKFIVSLGTMLVAEQYKLAKRRTLLNHPCIFKVACLFECQCFISIMRSKERKCFLVFIQSHLPKRNELTEDLRASWLHFFGFR